MKKVVLLFIIGFASFVVAMEKRSNEEKFFDAVERGDVNTVRELLTTREVNRDIKNKDGDTALMIAVKKRNMNLAKELLRLGANLSLANKNGDRVLGLAINSKNLSMVKTLLEAESRWKKIDEPVDKEGNTPLILAVKTNNMDIINEILAEGPNPLAANLKHETAATFAQNEQIRKLLNAAQDQYELDTAIYQAIYDGPLSKIEELIKNPNVSLKITNPNRNPLTLAMITVRDDIVDIIKLLMQEKQGSFDINQILRGGSTPLIFAIENSPSEIVKTLLEYGANPNAVNADEKTPFEIAQNRIHTAWSGNEQEYYRGIIELLERAEKKIQNDQPLSASLQNLTQRLTILQQMLNKI